MSHVVTINTELKDLTAIELACKRIGWTFVPNQRTYKWYGQWVDDSPLPHDLFSDEERLRVNELPKLNRQKYMTNLLGQCDHVIRVPGADYEIGLVKRGDRYIPVFDFWHQGGLQRLQYDGMNGFIQAYTCEKVKLEAQRQGLTYLEQPIEEGNVLIRIVEA